VTKPLASFFVNLMPVRLHPNSYTWTGFVVCLVAIFWVFSNDPDSYNRFPWLFLGICVIIYNIMDSMDGIVARLEQIPSCEGEVLDHMIDAVCTVTPLAGGWISGNPLLMSRRLLTAHTTFLLSHIHHRFSGGPLIQGIAGFGVDAAELLGGILAIIWFFRPSESSLFGQCYVTFVLTIEDILSYLGILYFGGLSLQIFIKKSRELGKPYWEMINEDLILWCTFAIFGWLWSPIHTRGLKTLSWQFVCILFTMSLFFYRTLYQKLAANPKNIIFAQKHKQMFIIVGWVNRLIVLLTILTVLDIPAQLRAKLFLFQGLLASCTAIGTLAHTHQKGPDLPKVRPPPKQQ